MKSLLFRTFLVTTTTLAFSTIASASYAVSLVPDTEGELDVGLGCPNAPELCISVDSIPFVGSVVSEVDQTTGSRSRLFLDDLATENVYEDPALFFTSDRGTNPEGIWYRPVAFLGEEPIEEGQLEVGTYTFNFDETLDELVIDYFDTETEDTTGVIAINGTSLDSPDWVPAGSDGNLFSQTFTDVDSITLKLGEYDPEGINFFAPGDGVRFQLTATAAVPEPTTLFGLGVVGLALAGSKLRKRH